MAPDKKLEEFFLSNGKPDWKRYFEAYRIVNGYNTWNEKYDKLKIDSEKSVLPFVNYEFAKRGFLSRGEGYRIIYGRGSVILGSISEQFLYFANEEDAEFFGELFKRFESGIHVQRIPRA
jgi:hypothetical protein